MILQYNNKNTTLQEKSAKLGFAVFCISAMFSDFISVVLPDKIIYFLYFSAIGLLTFSVIINKQIVIKKSSITMISGLLLFILVFLLLHSAQIAHRSFYTTIRWLYFFSMILILPICPKRWYNGFLKILGSLTLINVFFCVFFLIFKSKYSIMKNFWGFWPTGTASGTEGYRAGIASHYSENAMIMAVGLIVFSSFFIAYMGRIKKIKCIKYIVLMLVLVTGILLTAKRAHLLFSFMAILMVYFIYKPEMRKKNFFRILLIFGIVIALFSALARMIPTVSYIYERFTTAGEDQESQTRFEMWKLAINNFKEHPLLGIGWGGFKYEFHDHLYNPAVRDERYAFLNAHNVYIQLLCECGIVGLLLFLGNAIFLFIKSILLFKRKIIQYTTEYEIAVFSIIMQTFFYLYCLTGNCLYDMMFSYQAIAIGLLIGLYTQKKLF